MKVLTNNECSGVKGDFRAWNKTAEKCYQRTNKSYENKIFPDMVCGEAKNQRTGEPTSTCFGDSGGPYTVIRDGQHFLVGVTSWTQGCAEVIVKTQYQLTQTQPTLSCV